MSTSFHPETDGQSERTNCTLITGIRSYINALHTIWDTLLPTFEFAYNNKIQKSINVSPFFLKYGYNLTIPSTISISSSILDANDIFSTLQNNLAAAKSHLLKAQLQQTIQANKHRRHQIFNICDKELLSTKNLVNKDIRLSINFLHATLVPFLSFKSLMMLHTNYCYQSQCLSIQLFTCPY